MLLEDLDGGVVTIVKKIGMSVPIWESKSV